jgi:hypothetical protein
VVGNVAKFDESMRYLIAKIDAARIGIKGKKMRGEVRTQRLCKLIGIEYVAHGKRHAGSRNEGMRLGCCFAQLPDYPA